MKQEKLLYPVEEKEDLLGKIIKKFNFINEPYIIYPSGKPSSNDKDPKPEKVEKKPINTGPKVDEKKVQSIYDDAFNRGMKDGFSKGRDTGLREGKIEGEKIGREEGFKHGYKDGFEKGKKEGFDKGYQEGLKKGEEEFSKIISSFTDAISDIKAQKEVFIEDVQPKLLDFALKFAEIVTKRALEKNDDAVINILKEALQYIVLDGNIIVKVSISDIEKVEEYINHNIGLLGKDISINVIGDESLSKGSVVVIGPTGEVDARVDEMIKRVRESLIG